MYHADVQQYCPKCDQLKLMILVWQAYETGCPGWTQNYVSMTQNVDYTLIQWFHLIYSLFGAKEVSC